MYRYVGIAGKTIETHHAPPSASMFSQMTVVLILTGMVNSRVEHFTTCDSETAQSRTAGRELPSDSSDIMFCAVVLATVSLLATVATLL